MAFGKQLGMTEENANGLEDGPVKLQLEYGNGTD